MTVPPALALPFADLTPVEAESGVRKSATSSVTQKVSVSFTRRNEGQTCNRDALHILDAKLAEGRDAWSRGAVRLAARCWREGVVAAAEVDIRSRSQFDARERKLALLKLNLLSACLRLGEFEACFAPCQVEPGGPREEGSQLRDDEWEMLTPARIDDEYLENDEQVGKKYFRLFEAHCGLGHAALCRAVLDSLLSTAAQLEGGEGDSGRDRVKTLLAAASPEAPEAKKILAGMLDYSSSRNYATTASSSTEADAGGGSTTVDGEQRDVKGPAEQDVVLGQQKGSRGRLRRSSSDRDSDLPLQLRAAEPADVKRLAAQLDTALAEWAEDGKRAQIFVALPRNLGLLAALIHGTRPLLWLEEVQAKVPQKLDQVQDLIRKTVDASTDFRLHQLSADDACLCGNWNCEVVERKGSKSGFGFSFAPRAAVHVGPAPAGAAGNTINEEELVKICTEEAGVEIE
eukprot:g1657.t1